MEERNGLAWLGRKIGWGLSEGQLDEWSGLGSSTVIDRLVDPDAAGIESRGDPFADIEIEAGQPGRLIGLGVRAWIEGARQSSRPLETFMEFFWSDYFAVSIQVVRPPQWMFDHMRLLGSHGLGNFAELLRAVAIDPAMLDFLDGRLSTGANPNENFGRELLELYSVGVGNFSEDDVKSAARALTGWRVRRVDGSVRLVSRLHDDDPQTLLGVAGVHDLDTVIDAVLSHPATAPRVVGALATAILGPAYDADPADLADPADATGTTDLVADLAASFALDWELRPVVRGLLELGVAGHAVPAVLEPLAWYVSARKMPTAEPDFAELREFFRAGGQVPLLPPNVGGFPPPDAYLSTSATIARFNLASHLAERTQQSRAAAVPWVLTGDLDSLAERLGLVDGFRPATRDALAGLRPGVDRLAAALASPDLVVV